MLFDPDYTTIGLGNTYYSVASQPILRPRTAQKIRRRRRLSDEHHDSKDSSDSLSDLAMPRLLNNDDYDTQPLCWLSQIPGRKIKSSAGPRPCSVAPGRKKFVQRRDGSPQPVRNNHAAIAQQMMQCRRRMDDFATCALSPLPDSKTNRQQPAASKTPQQNTTAGVAEGGPQSVTSALEAADATIDTNPIAASKDNAVTNVREQHSPTQGQKTSPEASDHICPCPESTSAMNQNESVRSDEVTSFLNVVFKDAIRPSRVQSPTQTLNCDEGTACEREGKGSRGLTLRRRLSPARMKSACVKKLPTDMRTLRCPTVNSVDLDRGVRLPEQQAPSCIEVCDFVQKRPNVASSPRRNPRTEKPGCRWKGSQGNISIRNRRNGLPTEPFLTSAPRTISGPVGTHGTQSFASYLHRLRAT